MGVEADEMQDYRHSDPWYVIIINATLFESISRLEIKNHISEVINILTLRLNLILVCFYLAIMVCYIHRKILQRSDCRQVNTGRFNQNN